MSLLEELRGLGVDTDGALKRMNGNEALYIRLLGTFTKTLEAYIVPVDFNGDDYEEIAERAHAIKGTSGNLSITPVYEAYSKVVDLLRAAKPEEARAVIKEILPIQTEIVQCIEKYQ